MLAAVLPCLRSDQVVIASGALSLVPLWIHERAGAGKARPTVVSWGTTLGTARRVSHADVEINTIRSRFEVAAIPASRGDAVLALCRSLFGDRFRLVPNLLITALSNVNPVAHAAEALPNLTRMERGEHWFLFECMTPAASRIAEAIDRERLAIARAYGLVFYEMLARSARVDAPVMAAAITFAGAAYGRDFRCANALAADLGLDRVGPAALLARCAGTQAPDAAT